MSIAILRGHPARSSRYASVCSTCLEHLRHDAPVTLAARSLRRRTLIDWKNVEHPEWRKEAVRRLNARTPEDLPKEDYTPNPRTKDGFMGKSLYSVKPSFPDISTELSPIVDLEQIPEARRTLDCTRPAPIEPVERRPDDSAVGYYYRLGKSYLTFYKTGMKNIRANWREFSEIKSWLDPYTIGASARYGGTTHYNKKREGAPIPHITRRDYVLYFRLKHDLFKLLPFGLVLLVCGEFTPIAIMVLGNRVTPYTCRIPKQQRQHIDSALQRFRTFQREMRILTKTSVPSPKHTFDYQPPARLREHPWRRDALFAHLVGQTNFSTLPFPLTAGIYWNLTLQPRLADYWDKIFCDTLLIKRDGGFASLSPQDIYEYALDYGSLSLLVIMQYEVKHKKNYDFITQDLKDKLVPILDAEADVMFDEDFLTLHPNIHWMRAYRDSSRWGLHTPDVIAALRLMKEYKMEWSTDRDAWGGNWKVNEPAKIEAPGTQAVEGQEEMVSHSTTQPDLPHHQAVPAASRQTKEKDLTQKKTKAKEQKIPVV